MASLTPNSFNLERFVVPDIINSDTVIVGGGIAGLYTCYKLNQLKGADHTISLFESSNRFGGRIETVEMGGFRQNPVQCDLRRWRSPFSWTS